MGKLGTVRFVFVVSLVLCILYCYLKYHHKLAFFKSCPLATRTERIREACKQLGINSTRKWQVYNCLLTDDKHRLLYCDMAKVACSTFKYLLATSTGRVRNAKGPLDVHNYDFLKSVGLRKLAEFSPQEIEYRLRNYLKFIVVRHPFDRLLSTYNEKFGLVKVNYAPSYMNLITKHFGSDFGKDSRGRPLISFEQFLELVATERNRFANVHWKNYFDYCHPCSITYDHVIRFETLHEDADVILDRLTISGGERPRLPQQNVKRNTTRPFLEIDEVFSHLDPDIVHGLMEIYGRDFEIFGYTWNQNVSGCTYTDYHGRCC